MCELLAVHRLWIFFWFWMPVGFQAICKAKTSCVSCKTVGEKLATPLPFLSFPPPALSLSLFLFLSKKRALCSCYLQQEKNKIHPKPTFCSFSVSMVTEHSWPKQLSCLWLLRCLKAVTKMRSCGNAASVIAATFAFNC